MLLPYYPLYNPSRNTETNVSDMLTELLPLLIVTLVNNGPTVVDTVAAPVLVIVNGLFEPSTIVGPLQVNNTVWLALIAAIAEPDAD